MVRLVSVVVDYGSNDVIRVEESGWEGGEGVVTQGRKIEIPREVLFRLEQRSTNICGTVQNVC